MYNAVTADLIRRIPSVSDFNIDRLPQSLTRVYARVISLKTKYEAGNIPFNDLELEKDYQKLETLSNTLELFLIGNDDVKNRQAIAYVAATGRKLMGMIRSRQNLSLSLDYIPEELYASLLYMISGNMSDAKELADDFNTDKIQNQLGKRLMIGVKLLVGGKLAQLMHFDEPVLKAGNPLLFAEELLWREMIRGMKHLAVHLRDGSDYYNEEFLRVADLSSYKFELEEGNQFDIYSGVLVLSKLMVMAANELINHALVHINTPKGIDVIGWRNAIKRQIEYRPYLWDNHIKAIKEGALDVGKSAVITFPTGAGKTTLSELKITVCLLAGKEVIYLVPTHALENQVYKSMKMLVARVKEPNILNRDGEFSDFVEENQENPIRVMTPEHCLTLINVNQEQFDNVGLVVFDEFHLMSGDEKDNRAIDSMLLMTELLTQLPSADYLLMSAMVSNGGDIAQWIASATGKDCLLFDDPWKPTSQLQGCVVYNTTRLAELKHLIKEQQKLSSRKTPPDSLQKLMTVQPECLFSLKTVWDTMNVSDYYLVELLDHQVYLKVTKDKYRDEWRLSANYNQVAVELATKYADIGLKTIIFATDPSIANSINKSLTEKIRIDKTDYLYQKRHKQMISIAKELGGKEYSYLTCCKSATLHHANLLPEERVLSEEYFTHKEGVPVMVATPTIAQGINLPADIVIIAGSSRFDSDSNGMEQIDAHEILNAAGRAGRAGFRSHGTAILIPSRPIGMENNSIGKTWIDLKDEIFSKGDRCLEVEDPLVGILSNMEDNTATPLLYKLQDDSEKLKKRLGNSFYAYKMRKQGETKLFNDQVNKLIDLVGREDIVKTWIIDLAIKTHIDEDTILLLLDAITAKKSLNTQEMSVKEILDWMSNLLSENYEVVDKLLGNDYARELVKKALGIENQPWSAISVRHLFDLIGAYIEGVTLYDIEHKLKAKTDEYLKNARVFVIKVIPTVSFLCGTVIRVLLAWLEYNGIEREECSNDMRTFASCVKEGVLSYEMLMEKYKNRLMRVECHNSFRNNKPHNSL